MKRHEAIIVLSREHHFGLLLCWKIRQGLKKDVPASRMMPYLKYFWAHHLLHHFKEEEDLLFKGREEDAMIARAIAEHQDIKQQFELAQEKPDDGLKVLENLANAVDKHIRYEERQLFPHLEKVLEDDHLIEIGKLLEQSHQQVEKDEFEDEFWID